MKNKSKEIKKYIYEDVGENKIRLDKVYVNQGLPNCVHEKIAFHENDALYKCINCLMIFNFKNENEVIRFYERIVNDWTFK